MWQMNLGSDDTMGVDGSYPERHGEPDCAYYIRTGLCRFGSTCRFNHPHDRKLVLTLFLCLFFPLYLVDSKFVALRVCVCV